MIKSILLSCILAIGASTLYAGSILDVNSEEGTLNCKAPLALITVKPMYICDLYLNDTIGESNQYLAIGKNIRALNQKDTLTIHLTGHGGNGGGLLYLLNAIKHSKVKTIGILEGSVASAHTILLVSCDEIKLEGEGYLLFHAISSLNMTEDICVERTGKDRGIASYTKCIEDSTKILKFYSDAIDKYNVKYLTKEEIKKYYEGHDIIITNEEFEQRLKGVN